MKKVTMRGGKQITVELEQATKGGSVATLINLTSKNVGLGGGGPIKIKNNLTLKKPEELKKSSSLYAKRCAMNGFDPVWRV